MTTWHIQETRQQIQRLYGRDQLELARPSLRSVIDRQNYAEYHYHEVKRILADFAANYLTEAQLIEVALMDDEDTNAEFNCFITKAGAHVMACIQSMHAAPDILAHAIYYSLGMNLTATPLKELDITATTVGKRLSLSPETIPLQQQLHELVTGGTAAHLSGLANHGKHRSLIPTALSEDMTGLAPERHQLKLSAFVYREKSYPEIAARSFIEAEFNRARKLVIEAGNSINAVLRQRAPNPSIERTCPGKPGHASQLKRVCRAWHESRKV